MKNELTQSTTVLLICDQEYRTRFDGLNPSGKGVIWEGLLISQLLYDQRAKNHRRFAPVLLEDSSEENIPLEFRPFTFFRFPEDYVKLLAFLTSTSTTLMEDRLLEVISQDVLATCRRQVHSEIHTYVGEKFAGLSQLRGSSDSLYVPRKKVERHILRFANADESLSRDLTRAAELLYRIDLRDESKRIEDILKDHGKGSLADVRAAISEILHSTSRTKEAVPAQRLLSKALKETKTVLLIKERAGSGKTNLFCQSALELVHNQRTPALLITCGSLACSTAQELEDEIAQRIGTGPLSDLLHRVASSPPPGRVPSLVLFLDAINENPEIGVFPRVLRAFLTKYSRLNVRFVISCRNLYWAPFEALDWGDIIYSTHEHELYRFNNDELEHALSSYLSHYNIRTRIAGRARNKCRHPLLLRFLCETYGDPSWTSPRLIKGTLEAVEDLRLKDLFEDYLRRKTREVRLRSRRGLYEDSRIVYYLYVIAREMRVGRVRSIAKAELAELLKEEDIFSLKSLYASILDEDIILEEGLPPGERRSPFVFFVFEEFMEYIMACEISESNSWATKNLESVVLDLEGIIEEANGFINIFNVVDYLAVMLKENRGFDIWSTLSKKGAKWHRVILESIVKVDPTCVDDKIIDTLYTIYCTSEDDRTKKLAISILAKSGRFAPVAALGALSSLVADEIARDSECRGNLLRGLIDAIGRVPHQECLTKLLEIDKEHGTRYPQLRRLVLFTIAQRCKGERAVAHLARVVSAGTDQVMRRTAVSGLVRMQNSSKSQSLLRDLQKDRTLDRVTQRIIDDALESRSPDGQQKRFS